VRRVLEDKKGKIWLTTRSGGVIRMTNNEVDKIFNQQSGLQANYILSLEEDRFGSKYIGTNGGGLSIIQPNDSIKTFHITNDDTGVLIFNIHLDSDGSAWLVTSVGIFLFDGNNFKSLPLKANQKGEVYFDWVEDDLGSIWITSNRGILRLASSDINEFKRGNNSLVLAKVYGSGDGMRNRECTSTTRSLKVSTGEIWVPTLGGFAVVNPKGLTENQFVPPVYITKITTDDRTYLPSQTIDIEPGNLRYTFHYTALSLATPDKNKFKYKLEGENDTWFSTASREVTYTNLEPGNYTFSVIASNNDGIWNDQGASISFSIQPFFYQSSIFLISSGLLFALILFGIYKWRVNDIEKRNKELQKVNSELDKFVYSASHDLRAPLASVLGIVNIARIDRDDENQKNYLTLIEKSIKKLDGFISDIINFSRNARLEITNSEIDFEAIIHDVFDDLKYLDENSRISRHVSAVGTGKFFTDPLRVKIILSNLISNSFKYFNTNAKNPFIEVRIKYDSHIALIKVIDNGTGIAEQHLDSIFKMFYRASENSKGSGIGLYIVKETIDKIKGKIEVTSKVGEGTEFEIILPSFKG
jgi:signal transduction histidine kinase